MASITKTNLIDRFRGAPRTFVRRYSAAVQLPWFRDLADATALSMVGHPAAAEDHVLAIDALARNLGSCARSRAFGLLSAWKTFGGTFDAAFDDAEAAIEQAAECPYCLANGYKIRGNVVVERCLLEGRPCTEALSDVDRAAQILKAIDDLPGYGGVLMIRGKALGLDWSAAIEVFSEAHAATASFHESGFVCPSKTSRARARSYHRDAFTNLVIGLAHSERAEDYAKARRELPEIRRRYGRHDHLPRGHVWWLEGQLELAACLAAGHCRKDGTWKQGKATGRARDKVLSRYHHALKSLCEAGTPAELAALLVDLGTVDKDALADVLLGDENVLREQVETVLASLPPAAAVHTAELGAVLGNVPAALPELGHLREAFLVAAHADVPEELPAPLVLRIEDVQESAAVMVTELDEMRSLSLAERLRQALGALRRSAEAAPGARPAARAGGGLTLDRRRRIVQMWSSSFLLAADGLW
jgi:hypothetical protein